MSHALLHSLVALMPEEGEQLGPRQRAFWLRAFETNFDAAYPEPLINDTHVSEESYADETSTSQRGTCECGGELGEHYTHCIHHHG